MPINLTIKKTDPREMINEALRELTYSKTKKACGASLTQRLYEERIKAINNVDILSEANNRYALLEQKTELFQLNEIIYPYYLENKKSKNDFYSRVVRQTINELRKQGLVDENSILLTEGFWDSIQSGIGTAAGGVDKFLKKIGLKKEPKGYEQAQRIFAKIAEKEGNKVVQDLIKAIEEETRDLEAGLNTGKGGQKFPVNKNRNVFFSGVNTIATTYDTIVAATKKKPGEEGYMPPDVANEVIEQLRIVVQKYMADTEREKGGMYASFGGGNAEKAEKLKEAEEEKGKEKTEEINPDEEFEKIMRGQSSPVFARMTSLKAPVVIAGTGAALGALGWVANQPWFHDFVLDVLDIPKTTNMDTTSTKEILQDVESSYYEFNPELKDLGSVKAGGGGFAQQTSRLLKLAPGEDLMGSDASIADLTAAALKAGDGDLDTGLKNLSQLTQGRGNPAKAYEWMKTAISDPSKIGVDNIHTEGSLWKLFSGGTARAGGIAARANFPGQDVFSVGIGNKLNQVVMKAALKTITEKVPKKIAVGGIKTVGSAKAASAVAMMTGAAPVLAGIGLSTVVAGASLAAIRKRAKNKSRMGTLNTLLQTLKLVKDDGVIPTKPEEPTKPEDTGADADTDTDGASGEEIAQDLDDNPPPVPPEPNVTRLALARFDDDGVKIYVGTRRKKDQREKEQDLMQAAEEEGVVGRNTNPTTDTLDSEFRKLKRIPDTIKAQYDDIIKRMKGRSKKTPQPHFVVDKSVVSDIRNRLSRLKGKAKKTKISNDAIEKYVEGALKSYIEQDGKMNLRDTTKLIIDFIGPKVSTAEKAILQNALVSYGLVKRTERMPGLKDAAKAAKNKRARERNAAKKQQAQEPQNLQEHKAVLDRWKTLSGI